MGRTPAHAGRLSWWERLFFAAAFAAMAVSAIALGLGHSPAWLVQPGSAAPGALPGQGTLPGAGGGLLPGGGIAMSASSAALDQQLEQVLAPLRHGRGFAAAVLDATTGARAMYRAQARLPAGRVVTVDILAAVLLRHQSPASRLTAATRRLAADMIRRHSRRAAGRLWRQIGGGAGLARADRRLRLAQTRPGPGRYWARTRTTVADQLQLLWDLVARRSLLDARSRALALALLRQRGGGRWLAGGCVRTRSHGWVVSRVGLIRHGGHLMEVAVLTSRQASRHAGRVLARTATARAVSEIDPAPQVPHPAGTPSRSRSWFRHRQGAARLRARRARCRHQRSCHHGRRPGPGRWRYRGREHGRRRVPLPPPGVALAHGTAAGAGAARRTMARRARSGRCRNGPSCAGPHCSGPHCSGPHSRRKVAA